MTRMKHKWSLSCFKSTMNNVFSDVRGITVMLRRSYNIHVGFSNACLEEFKDGCNDVAIAWSQWEVTRDGGKGWRRWKGSNNRGPIRDKNHPGWHMIWRSTAAHMRDSGLAVARDPNRIQLDPKFVDRGSRVRTDRKRLWLRVSVYVHKGI